MGECRRTLKLDVPADQVWDWLKIPQNAFAVNIFHAEVHFDGDSVEKGSTVRVLHDFFGVYQEMRQSKVTEARKYKVAWGEYVAPEATNKDSFPHTQSYEVIPIDEHSCEIVNVLKGTYQFPGAKLVGEALFRKYMPHILDDDNRVIAAGCGAIEPSEVKPPKGLLAWPFMAAAARLTKKSSRRDVLKASERQRGIEAARRQSAERHAAGDADGTAPTGGSTQAPETSESEQTLG
jgi:hypothetical protein